MQKRGIGTMQIVMLVVAVALILISLFILVQRLTNVFPK